MLSRAILPLFLLLSLAAERSSPQQLSRVEERDIMQIILGRPDLSEFAEILQMDGLHRAYLDRQLTLFAPTNDALRTFGGRRTENLILNHMSNIALRTGQLPEKMTSLVTGNPPLWITRDRKGIYANQARVLAENIEGRSKRGDEQILHIIDSVLEPLVPISLRDAEYFVKLDASKLLTKSTLYELGGHRTRAFYQQADENRKTHMFGVEGQHTFFIPVDSAFDASRSVIGYDYERTRLRNDGSSSRGVLHNRGGTKIRKELIDARVVEGHIVPNRLLFTSHAPSPEYPTVAWLPDGIQVNISLQPTSLQKTHDVTISAGLNRGRQQQQDSLRFGQEDRGRDSYGGGGQYEYVDTARQYGKDGGNYNGRPDDAGGRDPPGGRRDQEWPPRRAPPLRNRDRYNVDDNREDGGDDDDGRRRGHDGEHHLHLRDDDDKVVVRSNTIVGDRTHSRGMVVSRIVRANIPVENGVVHLIDKPLMIVARSLFEYIMEEGGDPNNRLSKFAKLLRDKGGLFSEALLEAKDGTLLAPSNEAIERADKARLDHVLGSDYLRAEMLGLHFVRDKIISSDYKIRVGGDQTFSTPASLAANRIWFHYSKRDQLMTVEGRGVNATVVEKDIGTINGVVHVIDRVLGIPYQTVTERLNSDPDMSHMASLVRQLRLDDAFAARPDQTARRFTLIVPTNAAWEKAQLDFSKAYNTLVEGQFPNYGKAIMERHFAVHERPLTFEELVEMSRRNPREVVQMVRGEVGFQQQGEFEFNAYKDNYVTWNEKQARVIRPNIECTNGIIHTIDTVMIDDAPPWAVGRAASGNARGLALVAAAACAVAILGIA